GAGIAWTLAALPEAEAPRLLALAAANSEERLAAAKARAIGVPADGPLFEREAVDEGVETLRSVATLFPSAAAAAAARDAGAGAGKRSRRLSRAPRPRESHFMAVGREMTFDFSAASLDREFPVRRSFVYFNHAAVGPLPRRVAEAIAAHNDNVRDRGAADWRRWYAAIEAAREKAAAFVGGKRSEIAFLPNTSWGLNLVAQAFPWKKGDNVVADDMEFPSNAYPWLMLEKRGVECRLAKNREGCVTVDDIAEKV